MRIESVDPRDTRWEVAAPVYRVYFCTDGGTDEYQVSDADVPEVLAWAEADARRHRTNYVVYVRSEHPIHGPGLLRLAGWELPSQERLPGQGRRPAQAVDRPEHS